MIDEEIITSRIAKIREYAKRLSPLSIWRLITRGSIQNSSAVGSRPQPSINCFGVRYSSNASKSRS